MFFSRPLQNIAEQALLDSPIAKMRAHLARSIATCFRLRHPRQEGNLRQQQDQEYTCVKPTRTSLMPLRYAQLPLGQPCKCARYLAARYYSIQNSVCRAQMLQIWSGMIRAKHLGFDKGARRTEHCAHDGSRAEPELRVYSGS